MYCDCKLNINGICKANSSDISDNHALYESLLLHNPVIQVMVIAAHYFSTFNLYVLTLET